MDKISAMMDGELDEREAHQVVLRFQEAGEARGSWATYHVIGDVLRGESLPAFDVSARVAAVVAGEPAILAPRRPARLNRPLTYALSAAASVAAVAVVGWMAFSGNLSTLPLEIARNAPPAVQNAPEVQLVSTPSDGQMNDYLLAHQGVSPSNRLHGVAPYIRTISIAPAAGR